MTTRGIFILENVRSRQREGEWVPLDNVWVSPSYGVSFAYFAGGRVPGPNYVTIVDKLQFSSDSVARSPSADLDFDSYERNPVSSSTAAYWISGQKGPSVPGPSTWTSKTSKTTYSTDTTAASTNYPMAPSPWGAELGFEELGSTATETTGYVGGGYPTPSQHPVTQLYKLNFSTDGFSQLPSFPQYQMHTGDALGNQTHGYWSGGTQVPASINSGSTGHGAHTIVARFTYSTDTHSNVATLPGPRKTVAASGNATEGYIYGGGTQHPSSGNWASTAIKLTYATDTTSLNPSNLSEYPQTSSTRASGNLSNGYLVGGGYPATNSNTSKFDYSTGTQSNPASLKRPVAARQVANASSGSYGHPGKFPTERWKDGASETMNKGYFASDTNNDSLYSLEMNTDSAAIIPAAANNYTSWKAQGFSNLTNGWWAGGSNPGGTSIDQIVKTPYATDTPNPSVASMVERRRGPMIAGNMTHARIAGGFSHDNPGDRRSNFEKFTYSTESSALLPSVNLPQKDSQGGGSGNQELGYYTGGEYSYSWYFKVTYSNDTGAQVPSANQSPVNGPSSRSFASTLANFRAGASTDSVQKVPFADDTFSLIPSVSSANLGSQSGGAAANRTHGYYSAAGWSSYLYKMSFATETAEQLTTYPAENGMGNSLQGQSNGPVTANPNVETPTSGSSPLANSAPNFGVAGGGDIQPGGTYTLFDKLEYSTETNSVLPSSDATTGTSSYTQRSITSQTEGWSNSAAGTHLWKFVYSTSTQNPSPASHTIRNFANGFAISNKTEGYFGGGANVGTPGPSYSGGPANSIDKFTFSTSTASQVPDVSSTPSSGNSAFNTSNVGNQQAGYYAGGNSRNMGKYVYSTGTPSNTTNKLTSVNQVGMGVGNATYGYFVAGDRSSTDRLDYSTDTVNSITSASYPPGDQTAGGGSHSSSDAGYIQGGRSPSAPHPTYHWSNTRKITYSTSTISELPASANISVGRNDYSGMSARQNNNGSAALAPNVV